MGIIQTRTEEIRREMRSITGAECYVGHPDYNEFKTSVPGIRVFISNVKPGCLFFLGKKRKPTAHSFNDKTAMLLFIDKKIKEQYDNLEEKKNIQKANKLLKEQYRKTIKPGDIFYTSWGYDMTIVHFFQVIKRASAAKFTIRPIDKEAKDSNPWSTEVRAIPGSFSGEEKNVLVNSSGNLVGCDEYQHNAYKDSPGRWHHVSYMD